MEKSIDCLNTTKRKLSVSPVCVTRRLYEDEENVDWIPVLRSVEGIDYYLYIVFLIQLYMSIEHVYKQCNHISSVIVLFAYTYNFCLFITVYYGLPL